MPLGLELIDCDGEEDWLFTFPDANVSAKSSLAKMVVNMMRITCVSVEERSNNA
jgi:hypothetical protein